MAKFVLSLHLQDCERAREVALEVLRLIPGATVEVNEKVGMLDLFCDYPSAVAVRKALVACAAVEGVSMDLAFLAPELIEDPPRPKY